MPQPLAVPWHLEQAVLWGGVMMSKNVSFSGTMSWRVLPFVWKVISWLCKSLCDQVECGLSGVPPATRQWQDLLAQGVQHGVDTLAEACLEIVLDRSLYTLLPVHQLITAVTKFQGPRDDNTKVILSTHKGPSLYWHKKIYICIYVCMLKLVLCNIELYCLPRA